MSYLGQASHDERGDSYYNGQAGDQTRTEVAITNYYNYPWDVFLEPIDDNFGHRVANAMIDACENNHIGYDMNQRNTCYAEWKKCGSIAKISTDCETDCSALVSLCVTQSGYDILSETTNAPTTWGLESVLLKTGGFKVVNAPVKRGTVLLNTQNHVAIFLGETKEKVNCEEIEDLKGGTTMFCTFEMTDGKYKGKIFFANLATEEIRHMGDPEILRIYRVIYADNNGKPLPHYKWQSNTPFPWRIAQGMRSAIYTKEFADSKGILK